MKSKFLARLLVLMAVALADAVGAAAQVTVPFFQPGKVCVLLISGRNNHDWRSTTPFLRKTLVDSGRFDVRVEEEPMGITAATLAAYDVLALDYDGPCRGPVTERRLWISCAPARAWWLCTPPVTPPAWRPWAITTGLWDLRSRPGRSISR